MPVIPKTTDQWAKNRRLKHPGPGYRNFLRSSSFYTVLSFYSPFSVLSAGLYVWYDSFFTSPTIGRGLSGSDLWCCTHILSPKRPNSDPGTSPPPRAQAALDEPPRREADIAGTSRRTDPTETMPKKIPIEQKERFLTLQKDVILFFFFFNKFIYLFIYFWLCWVFVSVRGLSLVAASGGHSSSRRAGLSLSWSLLLGSTGSRRAGSVVVAHGLSCSAACGIFPDQGPNPCPLHWQADSQPLCHQGSPKRCHSELYKGLFFQVKKPT